MAIVELVIPKMGESIHEATIITWLKNVGDTIEEEETILEIATDKVDTDVPSPVNGVLHQILAKPNDVVAVGSAIALIQTDQAIATAAPSDAADAKVVVPQTEPQEQTEPVETSMPAVTDTAMVEKPPLIKTNRFYTPLVKTNAKQEGVSIAELESIPGTGVKSRVTKEDVFRYVNQRVSQSRHTISHPVVNQNAGASTISGAKREAPIRSTQSLTGNNGTARVKDCLLYTSPSPRDQRGSRMPSSA